MTKNIKIAMILSVSLLVSIITGTANAEESIGIFSLQSEISKTDDLHVTGFVSTDSFYKPVRLQVFDPNGKLVFMPNVQFDDQGQFSWLIHPPLGKFDVTGTYTIIATHEDVKDTAQIEFTVVDSVNSKNSWLKKIMMETNSEDANTQNNILKIQQGGVQSSDIDKVEPTGIVHENIMDSNIIKSESSQQEIAQPLENDSMETLDSPLVMTAIGVTIAGIVAGVVVWMRLTFEKPIVQK